jgi:hypothetical protein
MPPFSIAVWSPVIMPWRLPRRYWRLRQVVAWKSAYSTAATSAAPGAVPNAGAFFKAPSLSDGMISFSSSSSSSPRNC